MNFNYSYYELFEVDRDASTKEIKQAYRNLASRNHPDKTNSTTNNLMKLINEAKDVLLDEQKRKEYDQTLKNKGSNNNQQELLRKLNESQQKEARMRQQVLQAEEQARREREMSRKHREEKEKLRRSLSQQIKLNEDEMKRVEEEQIARFRCGICSNIAPSTSFWIAGCCSKVFCADCLIQCNHISYCPSIDCWSPIDSLPGSDTPVGWTKDDNFTKKLIEDVAPCCEHCGKNVVKSGIDAHKQICVGLSQTCLKCNGSGGVRGPYGNHTCFVCVGSGILHGDWTRCFFCEDTQVTDFSGTCYVCFGNKCIEGKWSSCFRCNCMGTVSQNPRSYTMDYSPTQLSDSHNIIVSCSITAMPKYADKSFEELRLEYYMNQSLGEMKIPCDVCHGRKFIKGDWIKCSSCHAGKIVMLDGTEMSCRSCDGKGSVERGSVAELYGTRPCPFCSASGCDNCASTGRIAA